MKAYLLFEIGDDTTFPLFLQQLGVLFITLSIGQSLFVVVWYRAVKHNNSKRQHRQTAVKEMTDIPHSPVKEAQMARGTRESAAPLLANRECANVVVEVADVQVEAKQAAHQEAAT